MKKGEGKLHLDQIQIAKYIEFLQEEEKSIATIQKYTHDLKVLSEYLDGREVTKHVLLEWKGRLIEQYASSSVNSMIAAVNGFLRFLKKEQLMIKPLKIQKELFCQEEKELTRQEYIRLVYAAKQGGKEKLSLVLQTICSTGIRVSELQFITAEAVDRGRVEVNNKGKRRLIFLPVKLRGLLKRYLQKEQRMVGTVFITENGKPLDRSNIWKGMKALCNKANVDPAKVFPHNLRHLFAKIYYSVEKDLSKLADILGHSSIDTTRIYTMESGAVHAQQMEKMKLIIT